MSEELSKVEREMIQRIRSNPVLWAKAYLITYDAVMSPMNGWPKQCGPLFSQTNESNRL